MNASPPYAVATMLTDPRYLIGALVLGRSLERTGWKHGTLALVTPNIGEAQRARLGRFWGEIREVEPVANPAPPDARGHAHFDTSYTKLHIWNQTDYGKLIYLDADTLVTGDLEDLLDRGDFAAAPDVTAMDLFNAGVLVIAPSAERFGQMMTSIHEIPSFDGSDQGFLNAIYSDWYAGPAERRLPMKYNVPQQIAVYRPSWKRVEPDLRIVHFLGGRKPWDAVRKTEARREKERRRPFWKARKKRNPPNGASAVPNPALQLWIDVSKEVEGLYG